MAWHITGSVDEFLAGASPASPALCGPEQPDQHALYQRLGYTPIEDRQTVEFPS